MITANEVKEFLSQAFYTSQRMLTLIEKINEYRMRAMRETPQWSDTPSGGHAASSPQAVWIEKAVDLQDKWRELAEELIERDKTAHDIIELLDDQRQKAILEDRHIWRMSIWKICEKYSYSKAQVYRIMREAYRDLTVELGKHPDLEAKIRKHETQ